MTRKATLVAVVALLAMGTSAALAFGAEPHATSDVTMAQETTIEETTTAMEETTAAGQETTVAEAASVTFENQTSNGSAVVVQEVVVPEGGFVVIHAAESADADVPAENETEFEGVTETETEMETEIGTETEMDGAMAQEYTAGEVLGNSTYLEPGTHEDVTVQLDSPLEESQVLIAMPHLDTNDNQQYDFPEADDPYTADGAAVTDWANVTVEEGAGETTVEEDAGETTVVDGEEDEDEAGVTTEEDAETTTAEM